MNLIYPAPTEEPSPNPPRLLVIVDTEEEFDWSKAHSRSETKVDHISYQYRTQSIFDRHRIRPTYVVDFPIAAQERSYRVLREWLQQGTCRIGAHLHPWVNPPFDEELSTRNSYPGNLPEAMEEAKLRQLTELIEINFQQHPTLYRAGRYGIGVNTGAILERLRYCIDTSVVPYTDFSSDGGPDFSRFTANPFWFGPNKRILELPLSVGWYGWLRDWEASLQPFSVSGLARRWHVPGLLARLGMLERIRLTPEGTSFSELKRLTHTMMHAGCRLFVFSYHSPSVVPGNTPYVRTQRELATFLKTIDQYCEYFLSVCGGIGATPEDIPDLYRNRAVHVAPEPL
jgi:hypothetical protein